MHALAITFPESDRRSARPSRGCQRNECPLSLGDIFNHSSTKSRVMSKVQQNGDELVLTDQQ